MNKKLVSIAALLIVAALPLTAATTKEYTDAQQRFTSAVTATKDAIASSDADRSTTALEKFNDAQIALSDLNSYWGHDQHGSGSKSRAEKALSSRQVPTYLKERRQELNDLLAQITGLCQLTRKPLTKKLTGLTTRIESGVNVIQTQIMNAQGTIDRLVIQGTAPTKGDAADLTKASKQIEARTKQLNDDVEELTNELNKL